MKNNQQVPIDRERNRKDNNTNKMEFNYIGKIQEKFKISKLEIQNFEKQKKRI